MSWAEEHKPRASSQLQLLLAGALWTVVGGVLFIFGLRWALGGEGSWQPQLLIPAALLVGVAKSRFILDGAARNIVERIGRRGDGRCVGGFLSVKSWAFVAAMILFGRFFRTILLTPPLAGALYIAVGTGLFLSSRFAWAAWRRTSYR